MTLENCKKFFNKGEKLTEMNTKKDKAYEISKLKAEYEEKQKKKVKK
jgi:hypothetical protein